ncbi:pyridoxal phosphate-dependent aminotransferase [Mycobacterium montefiorense]|uniref:N-succinyldiaminopimelate aminotransferase DapC n=1 Tax=Mycobacterium montefiorense TaxID=154654 RepID=A0AA37PJX1_9MYCO|nr:pyridoxal phosphate-dependent aminotransferase [Mycobacterium montefiorense]GBG40292.1 putative N-succinyldiaminopimelate aminotransferase DapC [Mycobacterium montefiorense]GKU35183.1 N-succinyldiaminopimelate aminotransferase DapC [Mycobacterium montefiorense]GKU40137.1 N-succinyldiaminopimelate aminotransferase DapC [Mycobacterium montefiorense]GKU46076.1 N-succinyldiaminopimelate aminotransferase DapC [Mycobacterium montefiorense]GKU52948.1 N-succinyldiaminopimelate aminotransferase DapC
MTVSRLRPYATTVFAEMSALAARIGAVNLGQGFPDEDGPPALLKAAQEAIADGANQYPPGIGIAPLRHAIAAQRKRHFGLEYDPDSEVLVTVGATEAIAAAVIGLVEPGSEVLLIEPFYDSYSPVVAMAGARRVAVPLVADGRGFALDTDALRRAVTPATRALIVNTPHNPTGAVLSASELQAIAEIAVAADLLVITDEVYEHLVFDGPEGSKHLPLAGFDGMAQRTITISSAAKMFNCTGWKIGWACGPAELIAGVRAAKQYLSYVGGAPFQPAVALALDTEDAWVAELRCSLQSRRDRLAAGLADIGFAVHDSCGTYFLCADPRPLGYDDSTTFCAALPEKVGVAAIPMTAFCDPAAPHSELWNHLVRFTFCKRDDTLDEAIKRLSALKTA